MFMFEIVILESNLYIFLRRYISDKINLIVEVCYLMLKVCLGDIKMQ